MKPKVPTPPANVTHVVECLEQGGLGQEQEELEPLVEYRNETKISRLENRLVVAEKINEDLLREVDHLASCNKEISEHVSNLTGVNRDLSKMVEIVEASN